MSIQFLYNTFMILNLVIKFITLVLLVYMTLKAKSKGLTLITVTYILDTFSELIFFVGYGLGLKSFESVYMNIFQILNLLPMILPYILYSIGVYLCYREWKQGRLTPNKLN